MAPGRADQPRRLGRPDRRRRGVRGRVDAVRRPDARRDPHRRQRPRTPSARARAARVLLRRARGAVPAHRRRLHAHDHGLPLAARPLPDRHRALRRRADRDGRAAVHRRADPAQHRGPAGAGLHRPQRLQETCDRRPRRRLVVAALVAVGRATAAPLGREGADRAGRHRRSSRPTRCWAASRRVLDRAARRRPRRRPRWRPRPSGTACSASTTAGGRSPPVYSWADARSAPVRRASSASALDEPAIHARTGAACIELLAGQARLAARHRSRTRSSASPPGSPPASTSTAALLGDAARQRLDGLRHRAAATARVPLDEELAAELGVRTSCRVIDDRRASGLRRRRGPSAGPALRRRPVVPGLRATARPRTSAPAAARQERAALMVGPAAAARARRADARPSRRPRCGATAPTRSGRCSAAALSDGGSVVAWLRATHAAAGAGGGRAGGRDVAPDGHGLTMLPLLSGERGPAGATAPGAAIERPHGRHQRRSHLCASGSRRSRCASPAGSAPSVPGDAARSSPPAAALANSPAWTQIVADALGPAWCASLRRRRRLEPRRRRDWRWRRCGDQRARRGAPLGETFEPGRLRRTEACRGRGSSASRRSTSAALTSTPAPRRPAGRATGRCAPWSRARSARSGATRSASGSVAHRAVAVEGRERLAELERVAGDPVRRAPLGRLARPRPGTPAASGSARARRR